MSRGGRRAGAGRPFLDDPKKKKVQISVTIEPCTKEKVCLLRERGIKIGKVVDEAVHEVIRRLVNGEDLSNLK